MENRLQVGQKTGILIVDDDAINRKILKKIFSEFYEIEEAKNGREGLALILEQKERFGAVLLDVMMPEMNGIEVVRQMKERGLLEEIPVFLITSERSENVMREAYELGVMDVIIKPLGLRLGYFVYCAASREVGHGIVRGPQKLKHRSGTSVCRAASSGREDYRTQSGNDRSSGHRD